MKPRIVWQLVKMNVMQTLAYRGAFFIFMINVVVSPLISLLVWLAVSEQGVTLPLGRGRLVTYFLMLGIVLMLTGTWFATYVAEHIRLGGLSPWLLRPAPYIFHDVGNNIGEKVVKLPLLLPLVGLALLLFRDDLQLPADPVRWLLFALSLPMAAAISFLIEILIGLLAFWVQDVQGLIRIKVFADGLLSGRLVPLAFFPPVLSGLLGAQPFRYTISFPLELLTGQTTGVAAAEGFAAQAAYCLGLWAAYRLLWRVGLRSYTGVGA